MFVASIFCAGCAIKWLDMEADEEKKNGKKKH